MSKVTRFGLGKAIAAMECLRFAFERHRRMQNVVNSLISFERDMVDDVLTSEVLTMLLDIALYPEPIPTNPHSNRAHPFNVVINGSNADMLANREKAFALFIDIAKRKLDLLTERHMNRILQEMQNPSPFLDPKSMHEGLQQLMEHGVTLNKKCQEIYFHLRR